MGHKLASYGRDSSFEPLIQAHAHLVFQKAVLVVPIVSVEKDLARHQARARVDKPMTCHHALARYDELENIVASLHSLAQCDELEKSICP